MNVYDEPENSNISDDEVKRSCAMGLISFNEVPSFTNRERYLCRNAQQYHDILSGYVDRKDGDSGSMLATSDMLEHWE